MRESESPPMSMHLLGLSGSDSKAVRDGNVEYWNSVPVKVPYGEMGREDVLGVMMIMDNNKHNKKIS
jgi:hypothetical protein